MIEESDTEIDKRKTISLYINYERPVKPIYYGVGKINK